MSISGYHIAEAGANPISQLAFTLANGFTFVETYPHDDPVPEHLELIRSSDEEKQSQLMRLRDFQKRNTMESPAMSKRLQNAVIKNENVFAVLMDAVRVCSHGQITHALFEVGGLCRSMRMARWDASLRIRIPHQRCAGSNPKLDWKPGGNTMRDAISVRCAFVVVLGLACFGTALNTAAAEPDKAQIDALRKSLEKYKDYKVAVRDLYLSTVGCIHYSGEKIPDHMEYPKGAMGVHFVNLTVRGAPDPMKPNVLIYEPVGKELKLVAVEWLVPLTPETKARPSLFGQPFMGPMEGHEPLIPKQFVHYDLHAWLFKDNPLGMFAATNPKVTCGKSYDFSLLEKPTKMVPGP